MSVQNRAQKCVHLHKKTEGGEMAFATRKKFYTLLEELGQTVDEKIDAGCEHILRAITLAFRTKGE